MKLTILHTNDIHSSFENFSKIVSKINELYDENTLVLDAGDFADFKRIELQGTNGIAALELLNAGKYDAIAIGNNETFNGIDTLTNMAVNSDVPFLTCNLTKLDGNHIDGTKKSVIVDKNGVKVLIIGTSPELWEFNKLNGLDNLDYIKSINKEIESNKGKFDLCIVLSHLGMEKDEIIASSIDKVDVIIGGHFHILLNEPKLVNGTIINTSGSKGEYLGMVKLDVDKNNISLIHGESIDVSNTEPSEEILSIIKKNKETAIDNLSTPMYSIDKTLWHDVIEENPITNLLADALHDALKCDLGLINSGILNGGIKQGEVSMKKILELSPSPLNPTYFEIQGKFIKEALQNSLDSDICLSDGAGPGFRGKYVGRLHVSSNVQIDHNGRKLINVFINNKEIEDERWYSVASSDYLQRGSGYPALQNNRNTKYNKEYTRDTLRTYLNKKSFVDNSFTDRWMLKNTKNAGSLL